MSADTAYLEVVIQALLRRHMDPVVHAAERDASLLDGSRMEKSQLQNVLNVAQESHSLAVVANFIRYQIGRARIGREWQHKDFGLSIVAQITEPAGVVHTQAEKVLADLRTHFQDQEIPGDIAAELRYEMMRHYLGYLVRAFVFGSTSQAKGSWRILSESGATHV